MTRKEILKVSKSILFNTEMVRAILDGRKTVTRRVIKPQPNDLYFQENALMPVEKVYCDQGWYGRELKAPYKPGDYLYVQETYGTYSKTYGTTPNLYYKADGDAPENIKWKPSIHMPKEAARIFLQVKDVKVERLCEISGEDLLKEGIDKKTLFDGPVSKAFNKFIDIWNSTIKPEDLDKYGWHANPWVWVIEFERTEAESEDKS